MTGATRLQVNQAEDVVNQVNALLSGDPDKAADQVALAVLTAGILVAAQLNNLASSIDTNDIAEAIATLQT